MWSLPFLWLSLGLSLLSLELAKLAPAWGLWHIFSLPGTFSPSLHHFHSGMAPYCSALKLWWPFFQEAHSLTFLHRASHVDSSLAFFLSAGGPTKDKKAFLSPPITFTCMGDVPGCLRAVLSSSSEMTGILHQVLYCTVLSESWIPSLPPPLLPWYWYLY